MKALKIVRTFTEGWKNFVRNGFLSLATVSIMTLSLFVISVTFFMGFVGRSALENIEKQLNISLYFKLDVDEKRVLEIKSELEKYQEIESIEYISKETAFDDLLELDGENESIRKALDEIGTNPLSHSLIIRAKSRDQYESINNTLKASAYASEIDYFNYDRNKEDIARLYVLLLMVQKIGLAVGAIFLVISSLITYNAIRLTFYSQRVEFEIMRLVGASNFYIRLPLLFEGILYGLFSAIVTLILLGLSAYHFIPLIDNSLGNTFLWDSLRSRGWMVGIALPIAGVFLGVVSSWIAVRKYLKI